MLLTNPKLYLPLALAFLASVGRADQFGLDLARGADTVRFASSARLEFIEGSTTSISGGFNFDAESADSAAFGVLAVDLRTLKTGIGLRDTHMRENHLETDEFPYAYFELTGVQGLPAHLAKDTSYSAVASGHFFIHGVKRPIAPKLQVEMISNTVGPPALRVTARFEVKLDDYGISRPKALFLKLAESVEIEAIFRAFKGLVGPTISLPEWDLAE